MTDVVERKDIYKYKKKKTEIFTYTNTKKNVCHDPIFALCKIICLCIPIRRF